MLLLVTGCSSCSKNPSYLKYSYPQREGFDLKSRSQMELRLCGNLKLQDWASGLLSQSRQRNLVEIKVERYF